MGNTFSGVSLFFGKLLGSREVRILMLGLDAAGKTTILYKLKIQRDVTTIPTVGFNVESFTFKNIKFNMWDVGGQDKIRPLWRHYYSGTDSRSFARFSSHISDSTGAWDHLENATDTFRLTLGTQALIFVVDSADRNRIDEARTELHRIINDREMKDCFLLVFANKQDLAGGT